MRQGARYLIAQAVEAELQQLLTQHQNAVIDGKQAIVHKSFLPEPTLQTGIGDVEVRIPKVRDRSGNGAKFNSNLIPPYLKRTKSIVILLPLLYLKGISTSDVLPALESLLGKDAKGLSANSICHLKERWYAQYEQWRRRDLSSCRYVWADGVYCHVRMELIEQLRSQGLRLAPKLAIGDAVLGFWKAVTKCSTPGYIRQQMCLAKVPKSIQPRIKGALQDIWMDETRDDAYHAFSTFQKRSEAKYPKATDCLVKDKTEMLAFYDYPAEQWVHIRVTTQYNLCSPQYVYTRTNQRKNRGNRKTTLMMAYKLMRSAETN
ncbi:transposase [Vibrio owensii]|uniref:transposase n=1 Tax=Vibrio owensii TaxID=696485 RepID=UPI003DA04EA5